MPHTPAPWTIEEYGDDETPNLVIHRGRTENRICFMATPGSNGDPAIIEADAHLICAAPGMLKFIERVRDFAREVGDDTLYAEADALIEKAAPELEAA